MLMFLSILCASLIAVAVFAAIQSAAIQSAADPGHQPQPEARVSEQPAKFFAGDIAPVEDHRQIPVELLLSQIERHVRLEQVAAERFLAGPTAESLRQGTTSPGVN